MTTSVARSTALLVCDRWLRAARSCAPARPPSSSSTRCATTSYSSITEPASCATSPAQSTFSSSDCSLRTIDAIRSQPMHRSAPSAAGRVGRPRPIRRAGKRTRTPAHRMADHARRWHQRGPDRGRTRCREDTSGRRVVATGLRAGRRGSVRTVRRGPRCAVPAVRRSHACRSCRASAPVAFDGVRGAEALLPLVPGLTDLLPDLAAPTRADPDTERYALFDAVVALLGLAATSAPVVLILDDLHWAAKPTLLLLRHLLRFSDQARVQIVGTYRSTDLDRSHPLAAMLADLHRDGTAHRLQSRRTRRRGGERLCRRSRLRRRGTGPGVGLGDRRESVLPHRGSAACRRKRRPLGPEHPAARRTRGGESPAFAAGAGDEQGAGRGCGGRQQVRAGIGRARGRRRSGRCVRRGVQGRDRHRGARWPLPVQPCPRPPVTARRAAVGAAHATAPAHRHDAGERAGRSRRAARRTGSPLLRMRVGRKRSQGSRILPACGGSGDGAAWPTKALPTSTIGLCTRSRRSTTSCPTVPTRLPSF